MNTQLVESLAQIIQSLSQEEKRLLYQELNIPTQFSPEATPTHPHPYPLQGKQPYQYNDPFESAVSLEDWEALK